MKDVVITVRLPRATRRRLETLARRGEIWLLHERSRLRLGPAQVLEAITGHPGYAVLS